MIGFGLVMAEFSGVRLPSLWATLVLGYVGVGASLAWHLGRRGYDLGTATTALACWPLLLGLVNRPPPRGDELELERDDDIKPGPNRARIDACIDGLRQGLRDELGERFASAPLIDAAALRKLTRSLHRADHRIARVDRLLGETSAALAGPTRDASLDAAVVKLRDARDSAAAELEAVLAGLMSLRLQLGLFALAGESEPVRARFGELEARVAALAELSSIELAQVRS